MQQVDDFQAESDSLHQVLVPLNDAQFQMRTDFNDWSLDDVLQHLHFFNVMADLSLTDPEKFQADYARLSAARDGGANLVQATDQMLTRLLGRPLIGRELMSTWHDYYTEMCARWRKVDPKTRVKWVGPDMSTRSSITARLMETWAHGQEVFDVLGIERHNQDRVKNVAVLGVNTYAWTFNNRGEAVPEPMPYLALTAPSGALWEWGDVSDTECIKGAAEEFCMVVTQTRSIGDTSMQVSGPNATRWMAVAQCFAGPPRQPPAPGTRKKRDLA